MSEHEVDASGPVVQRLDADGVWRDEPQPAVRARRLVGDALERLAEAVDEGGCYSVTVDACDVRLAVAGALGLLPPGCEPT